MAQEIDGPHPTPEQLAQVPLLASMSDPQRKILARLIEVEEAPAGQVLLREGSYGYAFYILWAGTAEVTQGGSVLRTLGSMDFYGEMAILGDGHRTSTVTATSACTTWVLFGTTFRMLESANPEIASMIEAAARERGFAS